MSNIVNKVKDAVTGHKHEERVGDAAVHDPAHHPAGTHHNTTGHPVGTTHTAGGHGPHSSGMANRADPRIDSDLDGSRTVGGAGTTHTGTTHTGTTHAGGMTGARVGNTTAGPHTSDMANKLDPRVDSDLDGSRTVGGGAGSAAHTQHGTTGYGSHTGATGLHGTHAGTTGHHGTDTAYGHTGHGVTGGTTTAGPHSSNIANKADPRVDSDLDGSRTIGNTSGAYGTTGHHGTHTTGTTGTGLTGTTHSGHAAHGTTHHGTAHHGAGVGGVGTHSADAMGGPGPAPNTAGPHKSDLLNKMDPRVDSDLDGSKTVGGNKTHGVGVTDTHDAAQVPPSQFQKPIHHHTATQGSRKGSI